MHENQERIEKLEQDIERNQSEVARLTRLIVQLLDRHQVAEVTLQTAFGLLNQIVDNPSSSEIDSTLDLLRPMQECAEDDLLQILQLLAEDAFDAAVGLTEIEEAKETAAEDMKKVLNAQAQLLQALIDRLKQPERLTELGIILTQIALPDIREEVDASRGDSTEADLFARDVDIVKEHAPIVAETLATFQANELFTNMEFLQGFRHLLIANPDNTIVDAIMNHIGIHSQMAGTGLTTVLHSGLKVALALQFAQTRFDRLRNTASDESLVALRAKRDEMSEALKPLEGMTCLIQLGVMVVALVMPTLEKKVEELRYISREWEVSASGDEQQ
jgi:hypothetical protein